MQSGMSFFLVVIKDGTNVQTKIGAGEKFFHQGGASGAGSVNRQSFLFSARRNFSHESFPKNSERKANANETGRSENKIDHDDPPGRGQMAESKVPRSQHA